MKTVNSIYQSFKNNLKALYLINEINSVFFIALQEVTGISKAMYMVDKEKILDDSQSEKLDLILQRLIKNEPIQYILGKEQFYNLEFEVNKHVLIPRPETEELVSLILKHADVNKSLSILDIGTGSGCIAIALKKNLPQSRVKAIDIDKETLEIAKRNALKNDVLVDFKQMNFLEKADCRKDCKFDIIVSNPPYIKESEKIFMHQNVLSFEPEKALFVPEEKPLIFYEAISKYAAKHLTEQGMIFLEINENHGLETKSLFDNEYFHNTKLLKDLNAKDRFIFSQKRGCPKR